jgi:uncharacterized iron-regulated membrane protein
MYASLFLVICALTGLMWSFEWYRNGVFRFFGADQTNTGKGGRGRNAHDQGKKETVLNTVHWDQVLAEIKSKNPGFRSIRIQDKSVTVLPKSAVHSRASDQYLFDSDTGEILSVKQYRETEPSSRIMTWAYALHVGEYGGLFSRIITFLASLVGASLPLTGYYLYFRRKRKSAKNRKLMRNILSSPEMK